MADFTIRVELHQATEAHYTQLHNAMIGAGFFRFIMGDNGVKYPLPTAEYVINGSELDLNGMVTLVKQIADRVRAGAWVLVTQSTGRSWNIPPAK